MRGGSENYPSYPKAFPIVIFGITCLNLGLAIYEPYKKSEDANAFATPLEILPEWYLLTTFNFLRLLCSKFLGILSMLYLPGESLAEMKCR